MIIYRDFPLKEIVYYKIGGKARYVLKTENREDLLEALVFVKKNKIKKVLAIGLGSNLLISDDFFDGVVLWFSKAKYQMVPGKGESSTIKFNDDKLIEAFASESLDDLIEFSFDNNLIGLEWAGGLPSTIGGAVRGNVGAFGGEIGRSVHKIEVFEIGANGQFVQKILAASELGFGYRDSLIKKKKNLIISTAFFKLTPTDNKGLGRAKQIYLSNIEYRNKNHPLEFPSCGSVFKNITDKEEVKKILNVWPEIQDLVVSKWYNKVSTGYLVNKLGFSGLRIGGAEVSQKHANYIVNVNNARFRDVISIIEKIKEKFSKTFGFSLALEVEIVQGDGVFQNVRTKLHQAFKVLVSKNQRMPLPWRL